ncbi:MAG: hypothetical protein ACI31S_04735 [Bacilli bacterium]
MDKYDYITTTIEEEKDRVEKIITYLKENDKDEELIPYRERYNNILKYLTAKKEYLNTFKNIQEDKSKLENLLIQKEEYSLDNILLEDTLLSKFNEDTNNKYKNILYEDIKYQDNSIKDILYLLFEKESNYQELVKKRNILKEKLDKVKYPRTYSTIISQDILIEKQASILDEIFIVENNIKVEEKKLAIIENSVMTDGILKLLYEFWIIDSYDPKKVDREKLFSDNRNLINIKNSIPIENSTLTSSKDNVLFNDLNLPDISEDTNININGKDYVEK